MLRACRHGDATWRRMADNLHVWPAGGGHGEGAEVAHEARGPWPPGSPATLHTRSPCINGLPGGPHANIDTNFTLSAR